VKLDGERGREQEEDDYDEKSTIGNVNTVKRLSSMTIIMLQKDSWDSERREAGLPTAHSFGEPESLIFTIITVLNTT